MTRYVSRIGATPGVGAIRPRPRSAYEVLPPAPVDGLGAATPPAPAVVEPAPSAVVYDAEPLARVDGPGAATPPAPAVVEPAPGAVVYDVEPVDPSALVHAQAPARADVPAPPAWPGRSSKALDGADAEPAPRHADQGGAWSPAVPVAAPRPAPAATATSPGDAGLNVLPDATDRLAAPLAAPRPAPVHSPHGPAPAPPFTPSAPRAAVATPSAPAARAGDTPKRADPSRPTTPSRDLPPTRYIVPNDLVPGPLAPSHPAARASEPASPAIPLAHASQTTHVQAAALPTPPPVGRQQHLPATRPELSTRSRRDLDSAPTHVTVSIDRVEIRAPAAEPAPARRQERQPRRRPQTLEEYMRSRPEGRIA